MAVRRLPGWDSFTIMPPAAGCPVAFCANLAEGAGRAGEGPDVDAVELAAQSGPRAASASCEATCPRAS